jgi:hypothetical protein
MKATVGFLPTADCLDMVEALKQLGCEVVIERERTIVVCRGAVKLATVPKMMVSGRAQYEILHALGFHDDPQYVAALKLARARRRP